jgi:hypothetical protein
VLQFDDHVLVMTIADVDQAVWFVLLAELGVPDGMVLL